MKLSFIKIFYIIFTMMLLSACHEKSRTVQGYVDADYTYVSSNAAGNLKELYVSRGNFIRAGQPLFLLDEEPEKSELSRARFRVVEAKAQLKQQKIERDYEANLAEHYENLIKKKAISQEELNSVKNRYENASATFEAKAASLQSALANLSQAEWKQSNKNITAPVSGYIYDTYYTSGEYVPASHPVLSLVTPKNVKIVFFAPETLLSQLYLNQEITVTCDDCKNLISANINYISSKTEYTPPYIYSEETRTKFVYRIEATPIPSAFLELHPGQPVTLNIPLNKIQGQS